MSKREDLIEALEIQLKRFAELALIHLHNHNVDEAMTALEQCVSTCESHPSFAKVAETPFNVIELILSGCVRVSHLRNDHEGAMKARALLNRFNAMKGTSLH